MREIINMAVVLTLICAISGFSLAMVHSVTKEPIEYAKLKNVKEPAVKAVLSDYDNDPIKDRASFQIGTDKYGRPVNLVVFPAKKDGKTFAVAFESSAKGYKGEVGVMMGLDVEKKAITGISVVSHSETPGLGAKITESAFTDPFKGKVLESDINKDQINTLSGATISTNAVLAAVNNGRQTFEKYKDKMVQ